MTNSAIQTSGLTDGRGMVCKVRVVGWSIKFKADEVNSEQSRIWSSINASMATLQTSWLIGMDPLNAPVAVNGSFYYEAKPLQLPCLVFRVWLLAWLWKRPESLSALTVSGLLCLNQSSSTSASLIMPRSRGIPRRGSHSGNRGRPSRPAPQHVAPITSAPPSSSPPDQDRLIPKNSYQTSRFMFQSRLNRPVVIVNFTIFLSEEENNQLSSTPSISSYSQDDSVLLGDLTGIVFHADHMQEDAPVSEAPQQPVNPTQNDALVCGPSQRVVGILHLVSTPDGGAPTLDEDGFVTWAASTSQVNEVTPASPKHAD